MGRESLPFIMQKLTFRTVKGKLSESRCQDTLCRMTLSQSLAAFRQLRFPYHTSYIQLCVIMEKVKNSLAAGDFDLCQKTVVSL